jgi:D-psicose/D-tagatose/L-ribulose 3-epimerase
VNDFGLHAMVLIGDWDEAGSEKAIRTAGAVGYDVIEVPLFDPKSVDLKRTRDLLRQHGIKPSVSLGLTAELDISSEDLSVSKAGVARLVDVVEATAFIGGTVVAGVIGSAWQKYLVAPTDKGRANAIAGLRDVAQAARGKGVTLAVEVVNRFESNLLNTAAQAVRFVDAIGEDNVGIHLDTFHMHIEEPDTAAAIRVCGPRLRYFHVNENHRGYIDTGSIDFPPVFRALAAENYAGVIAFEAFSSSTCSPAVAGKAAVWRSVFEDGEDVARKALAYLKAAMASAEHTVALAGKA